MGERNRESRWLWFSGAVDVVERGDGYSSMI